MSKLIDERGKRYGYLTVVERAPSRNNKTFWKCVCDCGREHIANASNLRTGQVKSCGQCINKNKKIDLTGRVFGVLRAIKEVNNEKEKVMWECECISCGRHSIVSGTNLRTGHTHSCGCLTGSTGEHIIRKVLKNSNIDFVEQYSFPNFKLSTGGVPKFDFAIFSNNNLQCLIEFDGEQHYFPTGGWNDAASHTLIQQRDLEKTQYCMDHNIPLVRIPYYDLGEIDMNYIICKIREAQDVSEDT